MRLVLLHGRHSPNESMDDWGFAGPVILGIEAVHFTYLSEPIVYFKTQCAATYAEALTGWEVWERDALRMIRVEDMTRTVGAGFTGYYGDWELQEDDE